VVRLLSGGYMTSLDMNGISITVLRVDGDRREEILSYIDMPVDSPFWTRALNLEAKEENIVELHKKQEEK